MSGMFNNSSFFWGFFVRVCGLDSALKSLVKDVKSFDKVELFLGVSTWFSSLMEAQSPVAKCPR